MERMTEPRAPAAARTTLAARFGAFVAEQFPFALGPALEAFRTVIPGDPGRDAAAIEAIRRPLAEALRRAFAGSPPEGIADTTPRVSAAERLDGAREDLLDACDGFLRREAIAASLTRDERLEILRGMVLTRATDNRLKAFFLGSEVRYRGVAFQGKGFRSLGQEAIYGAPLRLRRGAAHRGPNGSWKGDVVAPLIRDLGAALAMRPRSGDRPDGTLSAQMGKAGPPMDGKDLHVGDFAWGILPPAAPLSISSLTIAGHGDGFRARRLEARRGVLHRRGRHVARRVARGDQPLRRAPAARDLLRPEQPDGALDAGRRSVGRARLRGEGGVATGSRASRSTAPIPKRSPRRSPGRPSGRAKAPVRR